MAWASVTNKTERFDNTNWRKVVNPAIRFASKAPILSLCCLQVLPKWFKPSSHYTTLHVGRSLCCITWLDCLSLSRCVIHTMWLYVNDLQPGVTHYTTQRLESVPKARFVMKIENWPFAKSLIDRSDQSERIYYVPPLPSTILPDSYGQSL